MGDENYAFVDLQGFKSNTNRFVVKEIAILTRNITFHDIIKSTPSTFSELDTEHKKQAKWLTYNFHGLKWDWGFITLQDLRQKFIPILNGKVAYVKGEDKLQWLQQILGFNTRICQIVNIEPLNCALSLSLNNGSTYRKFQICKEHTIMKHGKRCHCALKNVLILDNWFQLNKNSVKSELLQIQAESRI